LQSILIPLLEKGFTTPNLHLYEDNEIIIEWDRTLCTLNESDVFSVISVVELPSTTYDLSKKSFGNYKFFRNTPQRIRTRLL
jgi:hypothetical protein